MLSEAEAPVLSEAEAPVLSEAEAPKSTFFLRFDCDCFAISAQRDGFFPYPRLRLNYDSSLPLFLKKESVFSLERGDSHFIIHLLWASFYACDKYFYQKHSNVDNAKPSPSKRAVPGILHFGTA